MSEIWTVQNGQLIRRQGVTPPPDGGGEGTGGTRPTGPEYIRYEDLYQSGDTVSQALNRLTVAKIVTFPEGRFSCSDFVTGNGKTGITIPPICKGIWGSGKGALGSNSGTIFTMEPLSSTKAGLVPAQDGVTPVVLTVMQQAYSKSSVSYGNFHMEGTDQGHIYDLLKIYQPGGPVDVTDVLLTGWSGDNGAPPGETFGLTINGGVGSTLLRVEADGRRAVGGQSYGAVGITFQNTVGGVWRDCYSHHCRASQSVFWQTFNMTTYNQRTGPCAPQSQIVSNPGFNHERTTGNVHYNHTWDMNGIKNKYDHITHHNDGWGANYDGTYRTVSDGTLKVINPAYPDIWGNNKLMIQSATPYMTGDTMATPPTVVKSDGTTHIPYVWVHGPWIDVN